MIANSRCIACILSKQERKIRKNADEQKKKETKEKIQNADIIIIICIIIFNISFLGETQTIGESPNPPTLNSDFTSTAKDSPLRMK